MRKRAAALGGMLLAFALGAVPVAAQPSGSDLRRDSARDAPRASEARRGPPASLRESIEVLSPRERRIVRRRLRNMPAPRRQQFFRRWESLGEGERQALMERFRDRLEHRDRARDRRADPQDGDRVERNRKTWRQMERDERERMKKRLRRFGTLTPEQQRRLVERRFGNRTDTEREEILERLRAAAERLE